MRAVVSCRLLTRRIATSFSPSNNPKLSSTLPSVTLRKNHSTMFSGVQDNAKFQSELQKYLKHLPPSLETGGNHKGQAGKIGIVGGSFEYTGAPYFAAISALRAGADLVHVFCQKDAAIPIKSYSPELIVHPLLDAKSNNLRDLKDWMSRMHAVVIGPGLGRDADVLGIIEEVILYLKDLSIPLIIDADGLFLINSKRELLKGFTSTVILTPNKVELQRLIGPPNPLIPPDPVIAFLKESGWGSNVMIFAKGMDDEIVSKERKLVLEGLGGSNRRCGGQGDILAGSLAVFLNWSKVLKENNVFVACYAASKLVRDCNTSAFAKKGRSMLATDMIEEIHGVFEKGFEH